jgi:hypothetical protein
MNTKATLQFIGTDALAIIEAAREAVSMSDAHDEVLFLAEQLDIPVSHDIDLKSAKLIIFCNLIVMERNTITAFRLG